MSDIRSSADLIAWMRAHPQEALEASREVYPIGDWEVVQLGKPRPCEAVVRRNHFGHVVAQVAPAWSNAKAFPGRAFCAWMTSSLRAPHGLYRATAPACMVAADAELQENPKCLLVNPRSGP